MAHKENRGGFLKPDQIENDLKAKGKSSERHGYVGSQDTGDTEPRQMGNEVQRRDGRGEEDDTDNK